MSPSRHSTGDDATEAFPVVKEDITSSHSMVQEFNVKYSNLMALFGRQLFSIIFVLSSASHFKRATVEYAAQHGVPMASVLVPLSGIIALAGGLSVLLGYQTRLGAWLLTLFLIPVTLTMHNFWAAPDPRAFQIESALFLRNVALLGGALLIGHFGGGPLSLDALLHREEDVISPIRPPRFAPAGGRSHTVSESAVSVPQRITSSRS